MEKNQQWQSDCVCPICEQYKFNDIGGICAVCFWENDDVQINDPDLDGRESGCANLSSLNDYKNWWKKIERIMPALIDKYCISTSKYSMWKYDKLKISRKFKKAFIEDLNKNNISYKKNRFWVSILTEDEIKSYNQKLTK